MTKRISITAKTLNAAIQEAAATFGVAADQVEHKLISQTNGGFLSFLGGGKKVEIEAWTKRTQSGSRKSRSNARGAKRHDKQSRRETKPERKKPQPTRQAAELENLPELTSEEKAALVEDLRNFATELFTHIAGERVEASAELNGDRLMINAENEFLETQLSEHRKLGESIEHILRKRPRHLQRRLPFRVFVDVGNSRKKRETELIELAKEMSEKVLTENKPVVLNYRSAYDRKVIHMALDQNDKVFTKSIGSGTNRKLMIIPADQENAQ